MSTKTRTSPNGKNAFGEGIGLAEQFGIAMAKERVTKAMLDRPSKDPVQRGRLGALLRGESIDPVLRLEDLVKREMFILERFYGYTNLKPPTEEQIVAGYERATTVFGSVTEHDRFIPGGLDLATLNQVAYGFNDEQTAASAPSLKLAHDRNGEWWRSDKSAQQIPTTACVFRADFGRIMEAADLEGRPFYMTFEDQVKWATEQGGDGVSSAEEALYLFLRSILERGKPLWGTGSWLRCRNAYGSGYVLAVGWRAGDGLRVDDVDLGGYWHASVLPRKSAVLAP